MSLDPIDNGVLAAPHENVPAADALDRLPIVILKEDGRVFAEIFEPGIGGADGDIGALGVLEADQVISHDEKGWSNLMRVSRPLEWFVMLPGALTALVMADTVYERRGAVRECFFLLRGQCVARFTGVAAVGRADCMVQKGGQR